MASNLAPVRDLPAEPDGISLYVHWPFCRSKCPYCDFNSHVETTLDAARWRAALLAELDHMARLAPARRLASLFFGGGTPSRMAPETCAALVARAQAHWRPAPGCEITLEANPTSSDAARFAAFRAAGVNRLSLGLQALNDEDLRFLGREHDARAALAALEAARAIFPRVSFDLIYARPGQTAARWRDELARALGLAPGHLSLYQLTIEKGTPFAAAHRRGDFALPGEDEAARLYDLTQAMCGRAGLPAYEISNHARPGEESRHNLAYWRYQDYAGVGPGAHGRLTIAGRLHALSQTRRPGDWLEAVERDGHATLEHKALNAEERVRECLLMGLRLSAGIEADHFAARTGVALEDALPPARRRALADAGLLEDDDRVLRASTAGRRVLNAVIAHLLG